MSKQAITPEQWYKINLYKNWLRDVKKYPESTIKTYASVITSLPDIITTDTIIKLLETKKGIYYWMPALKRYCEYEKINNVDWAIIKNAVKWKQPEKSIIKKHLSLIEIKKLAENISEPYNYIVKLQFELGCRIREVINIQRENITLDQMDNMLKISFQEKGKKIRTVYVSSLELDKWLKQYVGSKGYLFYQDTERTEENIRILYSNILFEEKKKGKEILDTDISTHWFRASRIIFLLEQGYDLRTIQRFTGHSSLELLEWYLRQAGFDSKAIIQKERVKELIKW